MSLIFAENVALPCLRAVLQALAPVTISVAPGRPAASRLTSRPTQAAAASHAIRHGG